MRCARDYSGLMLALVFGTSVVLSGCGGGGSGGGNPTQNAVVLNISAQGVAGPLWENINGVPTTPPVCPTNVFVNSTITFTFSGAVDPTSLPNTGLALGSINIVDLVTGQGAIGSFTVVDDPAQGAGNHRRVLFAPTPPGNPNSQCSSGLSAAASYQISIPQGGSSTQVLIVGSQPIQNSATTCFSTCGCPVPGTCVSSFTDPIPGAPYVISTTPVSSDPAPPAIDPNTITNNTIQILVSEALNPAQINLANVRVIDSQSGAQVPGTLVFHQAGSIPGLTLNSRIDYVASGPLLGSTTYQILFGPGVVDFGGNPIQPVQGNPTALLFFQTMPVNFCPQPALVENFDTTTYRETVTGAFRWIGDGVLQAEFPLLLTGTGADGPFNPAAGQVTTIDTNQMIGGVSRMGFFNYTTVNIPATATVRIIGTPTPGGPNYLAHIRCTGSFTLIGTIDISAGKLAFTSPNFYDRGPEQGFSNNPVANCEANGGLTSAGGGQGGTGSGTTAATGTQCSVRALSGENGFGPTINGQLNTGVPPNSLYAGGQGGDSGCFPFGVATPGCAAGDLGGLGGAGGTSGRIGEQGIPRQSTIQCQATVGVTQMIANPSPVAVAMIPPITVQSAGSGGGGGGDHLDAATPVPNADDQGGGGGGGGGGLRISCVGPYMQGNGATPGRILGDGFTGANTQQGSFGGGGGSGAGGEVWIQTFSTLTITTASIISVDGPGRLLPSQSQIGCSNQAAGGAGDGLVQLEAGQGPIPTTNFGLMPTPGTGTGAVFSAPTFQYSGGVVGSATSLPRFTGYGAPVYTGVVEVATVGNAVGATLTIRYEGFHEAVNSVPGAEVYDPATIKSMATGGGPITAANISELNGYAFIRFVVNTFYPAPPQTLSTDILPSVDSITINYNAAINCP